MPQPEENQFDFSFGYSAVLTRVGLNFLPRLEQFAADKIFPVVPTPSPSGIYNVWNPGDFLRRNGKEIANYEAVPLGGFTMGEKTFAVKNWGVGTPYTARDLAAARRRGVPDQRFKNTKTRWVVTQGMLEIEFRVRDLIQTTANWTTTIAGVTSAPNASQFIRWDEPASTPIDDMNKWKRYMRFLSGGYTPNTMVIPELVLNQLKKNTQILARVTPAMTGGGRAAPVEVGLDQIKILFGIENIIVPISVYNTAAEGQADNIVDLWSNTMWLGYVAPEPDSEVPSAGYQFAWTGNTGEGLPGGLTGEGPQNFDSQENEQGLFMREYPDLPRAARVIEGMLWRSPNVVAAGMGMTWTVPIS